MSLDVSGKLGEAQYAFAFVVELEQIRREVVERLPDPLTKLTA